MSFARGSQILTDAGWAAVETLVPGTKLWSGAAWVPCGGLVERGVQGTFEKAGLEVTPNHLMHGSRGPISADRCGSCALVPPNIPHELLRAEPEPKLVPRFTETAETFDISGVERVIARGGPGHRAFVIAPDSPLVVEEVVPRG